MRTDRIMQFLKNIKANNNRPYFNEHKNDYLAARADMEEITAHLIEEIATVDASVAHLEPKDCIYRIYRDIRFSPDKSPYKRHFGAFVAPQGGHRSILCGYYIHFEPGNNLLCTGTYGLNKQQLAHMRDAIYGCYDEWKDIVEAPALKEAFGEVFSFTTTLKKMPTGYDESFEGAKYLKLKDFGLMRTFTDAEIQAPDFVDKVTELCKLSAPFCMYVNSILTERD